MTKTIVKRAVWKHAQHQPREFLLEQVERACFRWMEPAGNRRWDGVDYLDIGTALKAMRVHVETVPACVGVDLTVYDVAPGPEKRAADACVKRLMRADDWGPDEVYFADPDVWREWLAGIIAGETNLGPLVEAYSELLAYVMMHRANFARAMFPVTPQGSPRDLTLDGLLYNAITEMAKTTGQDFGNLLKPLKEPVSNIVHAIAMPKPKGGVQ